MIAASPAARIEETAPAGRLLENELRWERLRAALDSPGAARSDVSTAIVASVRTLLGVLGSHRVHGAHPVEQSCPSDVRRRIRRILRGAARREAPEALLIDAWLDIAAWTVEAYDAVDGIAAVIPVRGAHHCLTRCLAAVAREPAIREVIVVCAAAEALAVREAAAPLGARAHIVTTAEPLGFAAAVNRGVRLVRCRRVLLLNSDAYLTSGCVEQLRAALDADPRMLAVGPMAPNVAGPQRLGLGNPEEVVRGWTPVGRVRPTNRLVAFCLLTALSEYNRLVGFWEETGYGNFDDDDFSLRLRLLGGRLGVHAGALCLHEGGASFRELAAERGNPQLGAEIHTENRERFRRRWRWCHRELRAHLGASFLALGLEGEWAWHRYPLFDDARKVWRGIARSLHGHRRA